MIPGRAEAADEQELEIARAEFDSSQYAAAAQRFQKLFDPARSPCPKTPDLTPDGCRLTDSAVILRGRTYYASSLVALDREADASKEFELILREAPTFTPSPAIFSQRGIDVFLRVRERMEDDLAERAVAEQKKRKALEDAKKRYDAWVAGLEKIAATESVVTTHTRWEAALPFGVGQFENGDVGLGILFLSLETLEAGTAIVTGALHADLAVAGDRTGTTGNAVLDDGFRAAYGEDAFPDVDRAALRDQLERLRIANQVSMGLLAATLIAGFIEGQISFVEETRTTRPRKLPPKPPRPEAPPTASLIGVPGAADAHGLGVEIRF